MKKLMISLIAILVCISLVAAPARAGSKQRHRWEGLAIGIGAALLGTALLNSHNNVAADERASYNAPSPPGPPRYCPPRPPRGHWEIRRIWVPATFKRVWNPAHYNHRRERVPGGWIKIIDEPGHWTEDRVWMTR
jgi:hypothetical protein